MWVVPEKTIESSLVVTLLMRLPVAMLQEGKESAGVPVRRSRRLARGGGEGEGSRERAHLARRLRAASTSGSSGIQLIG